MVAVAAEPDNVLERQFSDVAFVPRGPGQDPDLLTLDGFTGAPVLPHLALLRRDATWSEVTEATVPLSATSVDAGPAWLVDLGERRFAVVAMESDGMSGVVVPVFVGVIASGSTLVIGRPVGLDHPPEYAGAADVDGDGTPELVVSGSTQPNADGMCTDTLMDIFAGIDLHAIASNRLIRLRTDPRPIRLAGAALGEFDGRPGADLLVHAYETCPTQPVSVDRHHLLAIRLADGSPIVDIPSSPDVSASIVPSVPLVVDVDGDGRDEAVVPGPADIAILDPLDHWKPLKLADGDLPPLTATRASRGGPSALMTWIGPNVDATGSEVRVTRIARVDGSLSAAEGPGYPLPGGAPRDTAGLLSRLRTIAGNQLPAPVPAVDLDGDGCPDLLLPQVIAGCLGAGWMRPGPDWLSTRPIGIVGAADDRRLIVAQAVEWYPNEGGSFVPTPSAAAPGAWRYGPSPTFTLDEVPVSIGNGAPRAALDAPVPDISVSAAGLIDLRGSTGTRLLVRAMALTSADDPALVGFDPTAAGFLQADPRENEFWTMVRFPVPGGSTSGSSVASVPFDIVSSVATVSGAPTDRWTVSMAALDAAGDLSPVAVWTAVQDLEPPALSLDTPFMSPPWPFAARITGKTEAGASVRLGEASPAPVGTGGAFEIPTQLAPWPQTLEVTAVDPYGNPTLARVSVMGGVDLRQLPWPAIAAVSIIVAVALSSIRGSRRVRPAIAVAAIAPDDDFGPVIEELGSGPTRRRD